MSAPLTSYFYPDFQMDSITSINPIRNHFALYMAVMSDVWLKEMDICLNLYMTMTAQQNKRLKCEQLLKQTSNDPKTHRHDWTGTVIEVRYYRLYGAFGL
jgi:hypothetical protein